MADTAPLETDGPVFPGELFRMIGDYLVSDIKTLKNLAFTSRDIYCLVFSILYRRFKVDRLDKPWIERLLRQRSAEDIPCDLRVVKSLELIVNLDFLDAHVQRLLEACVTLESLSYGLTERKQVWPTMHQLAKLPLVEISLTLDDDDGSEQWLPNPVSRKKVAAWPGSPGLSKLEVLRLKEPPVAWITQLFTERHCPLPNSITCEIAGDGRHYKEMYRAFAPSFVGKIETWVMDDYISLRYNDRNVLQTKENPTSFDG